MLVCIHALYRDLLVGKAAEGATPMTGTGLQGSEWETLISEVSPVLPV